MGRNLLCLQTVWCRISLQKIEEIYERVMAAQLSENGGKISFTVSE